MVNSHMFTGFDVAPLKMDRLLLSGAYIISPNSAEYRRSRARVYIRVFFFFFAKCEALEVDFDNVRFDLSVVSVDRSPPAMAAASRLRLWLRLQWTEKNRTMLRATLRAASVSAPSM
jgi:hypothetical protein